jgi:hypothetical protein
MVYYERGRLPHIYCYRQLGDYTVATMEKPRLANGRRHPIEYALVARLMGLGTS